MKSKALGLLTAGLLAGPMAANAAFINGSISIGGGFTGVPPPGTSIVSLLSAFDLDPAALAFGGVGDLAGENGPSTAAPFTIPLSGNTLVFTTLGDFAWTFMVVESDTNSPLACANGICDDWHIIGISGSVEAPGFDPTAFMGTFRAKGSCFGANGSCAADVTASWSASLTALGTPIGVPEPSSLALLGLGLAGLGLSRRRKA